MKVIILAAGYATRLYPLTKDQPKPLLRVAGKTILDHIMQKLDAVPEVRDVFVVTNNKFYEHFTEWASSLEVTNSSKKVTILNDGTLSNEDRLGAVGDIQFVVEKQNIDENLLVIAGDNLFGFSLRNFVDYFYQKNNASLVAFYDLLDPIKVQGKFGVGILDGSQIIDFQEKPQVPRSTLASTACYLFSKDDLQEVRDLLKVTAVDNLGDLIKFIAQRKSVHGFVFDSHWFDIGSHEQLAQAKEFYAQQSQILPDNENSHSSDLNSLNLRTEY